MINIVTAFKSEAEPLIQGLQLNKVESHSIFPLYQSNEFQLAISGLGSQKTFEVTSRLIELAGVSSKDQWLNFGVAGSGSYPVGAFVLAEIVSVEGKNQSWSLHPPCLDSIGGKRLEKARIHCVDRVEETFASPWVYEMESSGFLQALQIHHLEGRAIILKLISDGPEEKDLNLARIRRLIQNSSKKLVNIVRSIGTS